MSDAFMGLFHDVPLEYPLKIVSNTVVIGETDEAIAKRVQTGNVEDFGILIERYEPKIARYAKRFLLGGEDAEDLVQEVFIKAYVNIQSFDPKMRFSPWIYRIAHNEFINAIKKKGRDPLFYFDLDVLFPQPIAKETADSRANTEELKRSLDRGLEQLDSKYREPLVLYYFEDKDYSEISEILQIPMATVGSRLRRGKAVLKKIVESDRTII